MNQIGDSETIMSDDLIRRLVREQGIKPEAAALLNHDQKRLLITGYIGPPCADRSILDRCTHHQGVNCFHDDHRSGLAAPRFIQQCVTCRPERWDVQSAASEIAKHMAKVEAEREARLYQEFLTQSQPPDRVSWDEYFFGIAEAVSKRRTCSRGIIGVVLVDKYHRIVSTGYPGSPRGEVHCIDSGIGCWIYADHCIRTTHAEVNAVDAAFEIITGAVITDKRGFSREGPFLSGLDITPYLYTNRPICSHCAGHFGKAGIRQEPKIKWVTS